MNDTSNGVSNFIELFKAVEPIVVELLNGTQDELWWRGHADESWKLRPRLYDDAEHHKNEKNLLHSFKLHAKIRASNAPDYAEHAMWLFLAQHYGLPTRLLDWTSSMLTALFFACKDDKEHTNKNGALWALNPQKLNYERTGSKSILTGTGDLVRDYAENFFSDKPSYDGTIRPVFPPHFDIRHLVQSSRFTLHNIDTPINALDGNDSFCKKVKITSAGKKSISETLKHFGITESYIYPDLEHISKDLKKEYSSNKHMRP